MTKFVYNVSKFCLKIAIQSFFLTEIGQNKTRGYPPRRIVRGIVQLPSPQRTETLLAPHNTGKIFPEAGLSRL